MIKYTIIPSRRNIHIEEMIHQIWKSKKMNPLLVVVVNCHYLMVKNNLLLEKKIVVKEEENLIDKNREFNNSNNNRQQPQQQQQPHNPNFNLKSHFKNNAMLSRKVVDLF